MGTAQIELVKFQHGLFGVEEKVGRKRKRDSSFLTVEEAFKNLDRKRKNSEQPVEKLAGFSPSKGHGRKHKRMKSSERRTRCCGMQRKGGRKNRRTKRAFHPQPCNRKVDGFPRTGKKKGISLLIVRGGGRKEGSSSLKATLEGGTPHRKKEELLTAAPRGTKKRETKSVTKKEERCRRSGKRGKGKIPCGQ